jgi:hypothetical protein
MRSAGAALRRCPDRWPGYGILLAFGRFARGWHAVVTPETDRAEVLAATADGCRPRSALPDLESETAVPHWKSVRGRQMLLGRREIG